MTQHPFTSEVATIERAWSTSSSDALEWYVRLHALTTDQRRQYVENLRAWVADHRDEDGVDRMETLIDLIEEMNERGSFA